MTHNAGIGLALFSRHGRRWAVDTMRTDQAEESHGGVWHVTIVAATALARCRVVCMCFDVGRVLNVAIQAHLIALGCFFELVVGVGIVHRMAGDTAHIPLGIATCDRHAVKVSSGDSHGAIRPKTIPE